MDGAAVEKLKDAGIDVSLGETIPVVPIRFDERGRVVPLGDEVAVASGEAVAIVRLKRISDLFAGDTVPPNFARGPTPEYMLFFLLIERTAVDYCTSTGEIQTDKEFRRLYRLLGRRPDGVDRNPLSSYLRAAARLYMSLRDVSRAEFKAVAARLSKSARTFSTGPRSRNYFNVTRRLL